MQPLRGDPVGDTKMDDMESDVLDGLLDDRPGDGVFRVDRRAFTDGAVFALEMSRLFERGWVFVGLERQAPGPNDFFTGFVGRQPILVSRDRAGVLGAFLNTCRHRGAVVCPFRSGNRKVHVCRYHGWSYDAGGRNLAVTGEAAGQYPDAFAAEDRNLAPVARLESYRGLLFASLEADVPPLAEHLGQARVFLDMVLDQGTAGMEFVEGDATYTFEANWKCQFENGLDFYHFNTTHGAYADIMARRPPLPETEWLPHESEAATQGSFSFAHGHSMMWSVAAVRPPVTRPLNADPAILAHIRASLDPVRVKWMFRQRNLTIFPNLQIIDIGTIQLRTWRPLAPDRTEMTSHCLAPIGEDAAARTQRIRRYEDFFNPSGLATSDDNVMYEYCQSGYAAADGGPTLGYRRGLAAPNAPTPGAAELGLDPVGSTYGEIAFGDETCFHAGYREWLRRLRGDGA